MNGQTQIEHILIVDSEQHITDLLKFNLESEHYVVTINPDAEAALATDFSDIRLALIDAMEQEFTGMDLLRELKENPQTEHIPVIILSHDDQEETLLEAFQWGADDFILKPFSLRELLARIRSVLRRHPAVAPQATALNLEFGPLSIDLISRTASLQGHEIPLTRTEFAILALLAKNRGQYFNRREIFNQIWTDQQRGENDRIVDTNISRLRKKLGDASTNLQNRSGLGYTLL